MKVDEIRKPETTIMSQENQKKQDEWHKIGQTKRIPGLTLFKFNVEKREISIADIEQRVFMDMQGQIHTSTKVQYETGCLYFQALNFKSAKKKILNRTGIECTIKK